MYQIINWICYISVSFLVLEMMIYLCKDVIKINKMSNKISRRSVGKSRVIASEHIYSNKIAK
ncbi:hypothetical protein [Romboutsia sp. Marseille-P6047]|uniref:hypothetical protein n=1 Tax=Romboutsia sp. Marseille-P6047 TaxID=2161817 RepID=UPI000820C37A|nr:hypothetical protein [Romboutsia sp. Marseille-P6047]SCI31386.1 Uncharacterised protein [uncultured Clostridium sp.]